MVRTEDGSSLTGLAIRDPGRGDLVGSSRTDDAVIVLDKGTGSRTDQFAMYLGGSPYSYTNGDMTVGTLVDDTCKDCELEDAVKYEFDCVETDPETGECVAYDFVLDGEGDDGIRYAGMDYESEDDEESEPMSVTFETDYCTLYAVVKSGQVIDVQELAVEEGAVTAKAPDRFAISFVEFYCSAEAAESAAAAFPSNGSEGGRGR